MQYKLVEIGGREYKMRLNAKGCVDLEGKLKKSILSIIQDVDNISISTIVLFFHASFQALEHGITLDQTYKLYDQMVEEGKTFEDFMSLIVEVMTVSGFFKPEQTEMETEILIPPTISEAL